MSKFLGYCGATTSCAQDYGKEIKVPITGFKITAVNDEMDFGELRVYFDTSVWNVKRNGIIYPDFGWLIDLHHLLMDMGFSWQATEGVSFSEQGMQGKDYVSLDICQTFIAECNPVVLFVKNDEQRLELFKLPAVNSDFCV